ncbi:MAG: hypothetical protein WKF95_07200 [Rubrobacter sp.]
MSDYQLAERVPIAEAYNQIGMAAGLNGKDPAVAKIGLANTVFGV